MDNLKRKNEGMAYIADDFLFEQIGKARQLVKQLNEADRSDFGKIEEIARKLIGDMGENVMISPPFFCDYGTNISIGSGSFTNYNLTILDVCKVTIGKNVFIAPNVAIYTAGHPLHAVARTSSLEYGRPVTIGDNVWIGGNVVICPGITIGDNTTIGAGSVVTKDIPANVLAVGNPCKVIREITDEDMKYLYGKVVIDDEAMEYVERQKREMQWGE